MLIAMAPLVVLFELSVLLARVFERRAEKRARGGVGPGRRSATRILRHHAVRPSRPRTPPHGAGHLPEPRHPDGRRARAVRHRRRHERRAASTRSRATSGSDERRPTRSRSASTRSRSARRPTRATPAPGRSSPGCASSSPAAARTTTRRRGAYTAKGKAELRQARGRLAAPPQARRRQARHDGRQPDGPGVRRRRAAATTREAVKALEFVIDATPNATFQQYAQLAVLAHGAKQTRKATLSADKAVSLAPKDAAQDAADADQGRQQQLDAAAGSTTTRVSSAAGAREPARPGGGRQPLPFPISPAPVAQLAEQRTLNPKVQGSIPCGGTLEARLRPGFFVSGRRRADDHGALGGLTVAVRRTITGAARERRDRPGCPVLPRV